MSLFAQNGLVSTCCSNVIMNSDFFYHFQNCLGLKCNYAVPLSQEHKFCPSLELRKGDQAFSLSETVVFLLIEFVLGSHKTSKSSHSASRILKVLIGLSHIYHPNDLNDTLLSQGCLLETAPNVGTVGVSPRTLGVGEESFIEPGPACRSTSNHVWVLMHTLMHCW